LRVKKEVFVTIVVVLIAAAALFAYFNYGSGTLEIEISNPPNDWGEATQVYLNYSAIEIHRAQTNNESGWFTVVEKSACINLTRTLNVNQTIGYASLQAGLYDLIRFRISDASVTVDDKNYTASMLPSDKLEIEITNGIRVNTGQKATMLIEVDVQVEGTKVTDYFIRIKKAKATPV